MSIPDKKLCSKCRLEKASDLFGRRLAKWRGNVYECLTAYCKSCLCSIAKESWRKKHGARILSQGLAPDTKICKGCGVEKNACEFSKTKGRLRDDGSRAVYLYCYCRKCASKRAVAHMQRNADRYRVQRAENYTAKRQDRLDYARRYRQENKESVAALNRDYKVANRASLTAAQNARYSVNRIATPKCTSWLDKLKIAELYEIAAAKSIQTGVKHHIDHVFPLRGKGFCGLNVPWNLQAIQATQNVRKWRNPPAEFAHMFWSAA